MPTPWLELHHARIFGGDPAGLTFAIDEPRALLVGAPARMAQLLAGVVAPASGSVRVLGADARAALADGRVALCIADPVLAPSWTPSRWVREVAALAGTPRAQLESRAAEAIALLELGAIRDARLGTLAQVARRAVSLAGTIATGARAIVLEDLEAGLPDADAAVIARTARTALDGRAWVMCTNRLSLASELQRASSVAIVVGRDGVLAAADPTSFAARGRWVRASLSGGADEVASRLHASGLETHVRGVELLVRLMDDVPSKVVFEAAIAEGRTVVLLSPASAP